MNTIGYIVKVTAIVEDYETSKTREVEIFWQRVEDLSMDNLVCVVNGLVEFDV